MRPQLDSLTGLRGLAAAWVVLLHTALLTPVLLPHIPLLSQVIAGGNLGVDLFFMLSGFVIAYTYMDQLSRPAPGAVRRFLWLRVARIYPIHLVTMLGVLLLILLAASMGAPPQDGRRFTIFNFGMNLFLLQAVPPALAWNDPAWSISTEFAAYLAFPLLAPLLARAKPAAAIAALISIMAVGAVALLAIVYTAHDWPFLAGYALMWVRIAVCFPVGALLFVLWRASDRLRSPAMAWWVPASLAGIVLAALFTPPARAIDLPVLAYPFIAMLLLGCASGVGALNRLFSTRFMLWSGRISYSVYLVHFPVLLVVQRGVSALGIEQFSAASAAVLIVALAAVALLGWLLYAWVEEPARKLIRRRVMLRANPV